MEAPGAQVRALTSVATNHSFSHDKLLVRDRRRKRRLEQYTEVAPSFEVQSGESICTALVLAAPLGTALCSERSTGGSMAGIPQLDCFRISFGQTLQQMPRVCARRSTSQKRPSTQVRGGTATGRRPRRSGPLRARAHIYRCRASTEAVLSLWSFKLCLILRRKLWTPSGELKFTA